MNEPKIEQCLCGGPHPHWRIVHRNGKTSRPFFSRGGMGILCALRDVSIKDREILEPQIQAMPHSTANDRAYDMYFDVHMIGVSAAKEVAWENAPVHVGGDEEVVFCHGRKSE